MFKSVWLCAQVDSRHHKVNFPAKFTHTAKVSNEIQTNKFIVSHETVVLRHWESETWKFGFIKRVDKGRKIWNAEVSRVSSWSERTEELLVLLVFMRLWRSFAIGGKKSSSHPLKNQHHPQFLCSLWRRADARNASFPNLSRWYFDTYQLVQ